MDFWFASFGCWNEGCKKNSVQEKVIDLLKYYEKKYKFLVILGDNYYSEKIKNDIYKYNNINIQEMKNGFDCLDKITISKKLLLGNHDLEDGIYQGCNNTKIQLNLPWYDIKFPFGVETHFLKNGDSFKQVKMIYLDTTVYDLLDNDNTCYNASINKSALQVKHEQTQFITSQFEQIKNDSIVIIFGHQPLITFRFKNKNGKESKYPNCDLLDKIYDDYAKNPKLDTKFYYICADFHNYEHATITKENSELIIEQIVIGTGGKTELDNRYEPTEERLKQYEPYKYLVHNKELKKVNGYCEFNLTNNGLTHKFISIDNDMVKDVKNDMVKDVKNDMVKDVKNDMVIDVNNINIDFRKKYLKYKHKYLELKNNM